MPAKLFRPTRILRGREKRLIEQTEALRNESALKQEKVNRNPPCHHPIPPSPPLSQPRRAQLLRPREQARLRRER